MFVISAPVYTNTLQASMRDKNILCCTNRRLYLAPAGDGISVGQVMKSADDNPYICSFLKNILVPNCFNGVFIVCR